MNHYQPNHSIKSWAEEDRPREKLLLKGKAVLSKAELIAILIGSGTRDQSAVQVAQKILNEYQNNFTELSQASVSELMRFKGIGEAKAITIVAAMEVGRRRQAQPSIERSKITTSGDAFQILQPEMLDLKHEVFKILLLNRQNKVIKTIDLSSGGVSGTVVDPKMIFKYALDALACGVILAHNHPSGNLKPSQADLTITKKIVAAGKVMDINVLDHLIITNDGYYSFADEGVLY